MALGTIKQGDNEYFHGQANVTNLRGLSVGDKMVVSNKCIPHGTDAEFSQTGIDAIFADDYSLVGKANGCWADSMNNTVPDSASNKKPGNKLLIERTKISDGVRPLYCQVNEDSPVCAAAPGADDTAADDTLTSDNEDDKDSDGKILGMDQTTVIVGAVAVMLIVLIVKN